MPYRKVVLSPEQIYHVFNRGVAALPVYLTFNNYLRFVDLVDYYRLSNTPFSFSQLFNLQRETREDLLFKLRKENAIHVEILAFCLMPNHFHFLLKQVTDNGISNFMRNLQNSYVKYFNIKNKRVGPLFQSVFKAVRIENDEQLLHVSRYIHLNPSTSYVIKPGKLENYPWSSLATYLKKNSAHNFVNSKIVLDFFKNRDDYKKFILDQAEYQRELEKIKHLTIE